MSGKETNYKEKYFNLKKTLQEYELLFADYEKQEKKNRDWWNGSIIFIYVVVPIPLIILSGFDIIKISHDFIIIFMTFCFTHALLYLFKRFFNDFF